MVEWIEKAPNWEVKNFRQLSQQIFSAEDDEPASDSNLVLLYQHTGDYIDSEEEVDLNPKDPPTSKSSNSSSQDIQSPTPSHARKCQPSCTPRSNFTTCHPADTQMPGTHQPFQTHIKLYANQLILTRTPLLALFNLPIPLIVVLLHPPANFLTYRHGPRQ
ncbi:hypothetical protein GYMLUDRAFT_244754 [Collybiopsis luxurians FD-317 M1]|uniref:Uncharacterized protein n=1 Tax=Collybiopsis luxurians FD-317 M1 TaxID=944289 RepID=A0A0D0CVF5_9AGAR|nr:hypothetical protein GYMLUDRAFT_244754 [Collybiopsis luxurians FD-317 M1]